MFKSSQLVFFNLFFLIVIVQICSSEPTQPHLSLVSSDEPSYTEVMFRRVGDNLTLRCEMKGDLTHRLFVWNYVSVNGSTHRPFTALPLGPDSHSLLLKPDLQLEDSGQYMCSSPPFSVTKFVLVQNRGVVNCARSAFSCGARCVLPAYVCDGRADCLRGEDEAPPLCPAALCQRPGMLNCSDGRCIPAAACCAPGAALCLQPDCCSEHAGYSRAGFVDAEYPALYEDRHAPDDYGFIQSTIYTVTACALIFMIAAVLLVSAICKMHMKRAALRGFARAAAACPAHQQTPRFPPCYEASRLLEQEAGRVPQITPEAAMQTTPDPPAEGGPGTDPAFALSRFGAIFSSRYRQVPTECDVEMTLVRPASLGASPARTRTRLPEYRSPTYCDLNAEYFLSGDTARGCELNSGRVEPSWAGGARRTLQLGRFQLTLPRLAQNRTRDRADIDFRDLDFVRLDSNDTYTLNGRTIRLLGGNFESYPRPPPYDPCKASGPPPLYLARDAPGRDTCLARDMDTEAVANVEPPPRYEDCNANGELLERVSVALNAIAESGESLDSIPAIDDCNANEIVE